MQSNHALLILDLLIAGCSGTMMTDRMRDDVGDTLAEDQQHLAASRTISSLPVMVEEVDHHTSRTIAIMDDMSSEMASMRHCSAIESMMALRDRMRAEVDAHAATMHAEPGVVEARAEVEHHVGAMGTMLGDMGAMLDGAHCSGW